jgi:hypothetical protein
MIDRHTAYINNNEGGVNILVVHLLNGSTRLCQITTVPVKPRSRPNRLCSGMKFVLTFEDMGLEFNHAIDPSVIEDTNCTSRIDAKDASDAAGAVGAELILVAESYLLAINNALECSTSIMSMISGPRKPFLGQVIQDPTSRRTSFPSVARAAVPNYMHFAL